MDHPTTASTVVIRSTNALEPLQTRVNIGPNRVHLPERTVHDLPQGIRREVSKRDLENPSIPRSRMGVNGHHKVNEAPPHERKIGARECLSRPLEDKESALFEYQEFTFGTCGQGLANAVHSARGRCGHTANMETRDTKVERRQRVNIELC